MASLNYYLSLGFSLIVLALAVSRINATDAKLSALESRITVLEMRK